MDWRKRLGEGRHYLEMCASLCIQMKGKAPLYINAHIHSMHLILLVCLFHSEGLHFFPLQLGILEVTMETTPEGQVLKIVSLKEY